MITDLYGRKWHHATDRDFKDMLQISEQHAQWAMETHYKLHGDGVAWTTNDTGSVDPYLLKIGTTWYFGIRYGNAGYEYYSPGLDWRIISLLLDMHKSTARAIETPALAWLGLVPA